MIVGKFLSGTVGRCCDIFKRNKRIDGICSLNVPVLFTVAAECSGRNMECPGSFAGYGFVKPYIAVFVAPATDFASVGLRAVGQHNFLGVIDIHAVGRIGEREGDFRNTADGRAVGRVKAICIENTGSCRINGICSRNRRISQSIAQCKITDSIIPAIFADDSGGDGQRICAGGSLGGKHKVNLVHGPVFDKLPLCCGNSVGTGKLEGCLGDFAGNTLHHVFRVFKTESKTHSGN